MNYKLLLLCLLLFSLLFLSLTASAAITTPSDNEVLTQDFFVTILTNENVTAVEAKLISYPWFSLENISSTAWTYKINITSYPNGDYILSARYTDPNGTYFLSPINVKFQYTVVTPTPTTTLQIPKTLSIMGLVANGSYSNKSKIWVNVVDSITNAPVQASITLNNPDPLIIWNTVEGLTKMDFSPYPNDTYLIRVSAGGYNQKSFFITLYEPLLSFAVSGLRSVYLAGENVSIQVTPQANVTLTYYNNTLISTISPNSPDYYVNTSGLADGDYRIKAEKPGYSMWTGEFTVIRPSRTYTPTPTATPYNILDQPIEMTVNGEKKNITVAQLKDWYVLDYVRRAQATPAPTPAQTTPVPPPLPTTPPESSGGISLTTLFLIIGVIILGWAAHRWYSKRKVVVSQEVRDAVILDSLPANSKTTASRQDTSGQRIIKCKGGKCDWSVVVDETTSDEVIAVILEAHDNDPTAHNIKKPAKKVNAQDEEAK